MSNRTQVINRWSVALVYVGFIYATLGTARSFINPLRNLGVLNLTLLLGYIAIAGAVLLFLVRKKAADARRLIVWAAIFSVYYFLAKDLRSPEEKIHFFEYGLVGYFFYKAFQLHIKKNWGIFLAAFVTGSLAGAVDELIQKTIPGRYYDPRDIGLNIISVGLGLILLSLFPSRNEPDAPATTRSESE